MRLSDWRKTAPHKDSLDSKVLAVLRTVLLDLGAEADPECWVAWGEDPESRYSVLAPATAGVIYVAVRLGGSVDGPRATARLIRWPKLTVSELSVDATGDHRIVAVQVESLVLKGADEEADRICEFVRGLIAGIDNRNPQPIPIAVVRGAGAVTAAVPAKPARAEAAPKRAAGASKATGAAKPKTSGAPVPAATKVAARTSHAPTALSVVPHAAAPAAPAPLKPIAERAAAAHQGQPGTGTPRPGHQAPEPVADRSEWVAPHPIEEPASREPNRSRPWTP
jgi:hypothetical protein